MPTDGEEEWEKIRTGVRLERKTPAELLGIFQQVIPNSATVLREKFYWGMGKVEEMPPKKYIGFKTRSLGEDNFNMSGTTEGGEFVHLNINDDINVAVQNHEDGRRSVVISHESKSRGGQVVRRYTVVPSAPNV